MARVQQLADKILSLAGNGLLSPFSIDAAWSVTRRLLTVHPGIYLSTLLATWVALLACQSVNREADMRAAAQRIHADAVVAAQAVLSQSEQQQLPVPVAAPAAPGVSIAPAINLPRPDAGMFASLAAYPGMDNLLTVQRPAPMPKKAPRIASGLVPPPPPSGLVPPPPPTVPIPTAMLTQTSPYFGQSIAAASPIPGGPGAAAAANEMFFASAAYTPAPAVMGGGDSLNSASAGRSGDSYKVVQHRQRKRTIAYR